VDGLLFHPFTHTPVYLFANLLTKRMIPQQFIEEVQSRTDIAELISSYVSLKKTGRNFKAICPFHGEKTPSFIVSPQKQIFHCFGCGEGGGVFQFLTLIEKVTFPEAVEMLAKRLGMAMPYQKSKGAKTKNFLYEATSKAASFFHNILNESKECQAIRTYSEKRGIGPETIKKFHLGFAPGHNSLIQYMRKSGFTLEVLEKASLVTSSRGSFRDLFINRITFPIFDAQARVVGFGARTWKDVPDSPKYINSLENALYSKREHLYGLNFSKDEIIKEDSVVVVEGYLDMITPFMRGIKNIVASLGTALTSEQIRLIKRYVSCVVLAYDSDKAGETATERSIDLLLENDLKVKVVRLPEGYDPDSLVRKHGKEAFLKLLDEKFDFFDYKLDSLKRAYDVDSIEGKTKIAKEMLITLDKLSSEIQKYEYIRKLADNLGLREEIVIAEFRNILPKTNKNYGKGKASLVTPANSRINNEFVPITERVVIKGMLTNPKALMLARKKLKKEYFSSHLSQKTVLFLFGNYSAEGNGSMQKLLGMIEDKEISSFISKILMDENILLNNEEFKGSLAKLCKDGVKQLKVRLREEIREAEARGDEERKIELMNKHKKLIAG